jgi:hypothetical protein
VVSSGSHQHAVPNQSLFVAMGVFTVVNEQDAPFQLWIKTSRKTRLDEDLSRLVKSCFVRSLYQGYERCMLYPMP